VYVPIAEAAATLELSRARVYGLIAEGAIPAVRVGRRIRIPRASFDRWLEDQERKALESLRDPLDVSREDLALEELEKLEGLVPKIANKGEVR
jgi:excisionase family DNA binding protein